MHKKIHFFNLAFMLMSLLIFTTGCHLELQNHPGHQDENLSLSAPPQYDESKLNRPFTQEDIISNETQTNEIVFLGIIIVLIIFISSFMVSWRRRMEQRKPSLE